MTININDLETLEIPLNQLFAWEGNVRTTDADEEPDDEDIDELAASIASVGLLSTPVVKKGPTPQVCRDRRRTKAKKRSINWPKTARLRPITR